MPDFPATINKEPPTPAHLGQQLHGRPTAVARVGPLLAGQAVQLSSRQAVQLLRLRLGHILTAVQARRHGCKAAEAVQQEGLGSGGGKRWRRRRGGGVRIG